MSTVKRGRGLPRKEPHGTPQQPAVGLGEASVSIPEITAQQPTVVRGEAGVAEPESIAQQHAVVEGEAIEGEASGAKSESPARRAVV